MQVVIKFILFLVLGSEFPPSFWALTSIAHNSWVHQFIYNQDYLLTKGRRWHIFIT